MKINNFFRTYSKRMLASLVAAVLIVGVSIAAIPQKTSAATITVNSPTNGQQFTGNDFTVSGVADSDASVFLIRNGLTIAQTRSDENGAWNAHLTGLPDGQNTITVRSIKNTGYAIFSSSTDNGVTTKINQLRLSDNSINPNAPFPVTQTVPHIAFVPSTTSNTFYAVGSFAGANKPAKFDADSPADPVTTSGSYNAGYLANAGAFSADGTKYFSPNINSNIVSVIDATNNSFSTDIDVGASVVTAWRAPNGNIFVGTQQGGGLKIINPTDNSIIKTIAPSCGNTATIPAVTFSQDSAYPYYFVYCHGEAHHILKYDIATDTQVSDFDTGSYTAVTGAMNADNTKLYVASTSSQPGLTETDKIKVYDTSNGTLIKPIQMHAGMIGIFQSPDLQHIYAATPGTADNNFSSTGLDVLDMLTDSVVHVDTGSTALAVTASSTAATLTNVNVSVVLGVKTATSGGGTLANTGALAVSSSLLVGLLVATFAYTYWDYRRHKQPLVEVDPDAQHTYTYLHHVRMVTIPLLKYRVNFSVARANGQDGIHKF